MKEAKKKDKRPAKKLTVVKETHSNLASLILKRFLLPLALIKNSAQEELLNFNLKDLNIPNSAILETEKSISAPNFFHKLHNSDISIIRFGAHLAKAFSVGNSYKFQVNSDVDVILNPIESGAGQKRVIIKGTNRYDRFIESFENTQTLLMTNPPIDFTSPSLIDERISRLPSNIGSNPPEILANLLPRNNTENLKQRIFKPQTSYLIVDAVFGSRFVKSEIGKKQANVFHYEIGEDNKFTRKIHYSFTDEIVDQFLDYPPDPSIKSREALYYSSFNFIPVKDKHIMIITHTRWRVSSFKIFDIVDKFAVNPNCVYMLYTSPYEFPDKFLVSSDRKTAMVLYKEISQDPSISQWVKLGIVDTTSTTGGFEVILNLGIFGANPSFFSIDQSSKPFLYELETKNHQVVTGIMDLSNTIHEHWLVFDYHDGSIVGKLYVETKNSPIHYSQYLKDSDTLIVIWNDYATRVSNYGFQTFKLYTYRMSDFEFLSSSDFSLDFPIIDTSDIIVSSRNIERFMKFEGMRPLVIISKYSSTVSYRVLFESPCHPSCLSCSFDETIFGCDKCRPGYEAVGDGRCVCPDGFYDDGSVCQSCDDSCETCFNSGVDSCMTVLCAPPMVRVFNDSLKCACPFDYMIPDPSNSSRCINCIDEAHEVCPPQILYYPERLEIVDDDNIHLVTNFDLFKYMKEEKLSLVDLGQNFEVIISNSILAVDSIKTKLKPSDYTVTYSNNYFVIEIDNSLTSPLEDSVIIVRTSKGSIEDPFQINSLPKLYLRNLEFELTYIRSQEIEVTDSFVTTAKNVFGELPVSTILWVLYGILIL